VVSPPGTGVPVPGANAGSIAIAHGDRHDRHAEPLRDPERTAVKRLDLVAGGRRASRKVQHRHPGCEQVVDVAQHACARHRIVTRDERDAERRADWPDDRPGRDLALAHRQRRAHG
jgi:hypothetical protein